MNKSTKKFLINTAQIAGLTVAALLLWYAASAVSGSDLIIPDPRTVIVLAFRLLGSGEIWLALLATLARSAAAFALSVAFAFGAALLTGVFPKTRFCVDAAVTFLRALPTIAAILAMLVVFRSSAVPVVVAFLVEFPVAYGAFERQFDRNAGLFDVCKVYNVSAANKVRFYLLPLIGREMLSVSEEGVSLCVKVVIAGEVLALPLKAVGREMYISKISVETARVAALTLLSLVLCFAISGILGYFRRRRGD